MSEPRRWNLVVEGLILAVSGGPSVSLQEAEKGIPVIEAEPVLARIKELEAQLKEANEHLALALSFAPKGPVPRDLDPTFYHTFEYESEVKLQEQIDAARVYLNKWEGK